MKELLEKIWRAVRHNQGLVVSVVIVVGLLIWSYGCESRVVSLSNSAVMVTRAELEVEIDTFMNTAEVRLSDLERQDEIKRKLFEFAAVAAESGTVNRSTVLSLISWILFGGLLIDNRRKDGVIKGNNKKE